MNEIKKEFLGKETKIVVLSNYLVENGFKSIVMKDVKFNEELWNGTLANKNNEFKAEFDLISLVETKGLEILSEIKITKIL